MNRKSLFGILTIIFPILVAMAYPLWPTESPQLSRTLTPDPELLRVAGQVGGPTQAVAVQGNYAYVGVGLRLVVLDISNPASVQEVGTTEPFEWYVEDVAVSGRTAYVGVGGCLYILDISDPSHPAVSGVYKTSGYVEGVTIFGCYAYLADGPAGLRIVDIGDPVDTVEVGSAYSLNYVFDVAVKGQYAYLAAAGAGLLVADISDAACPVEVASCDTLGYAYGVAVSGDSAYIADGWGGFRIVDIFDPSNPREVGSLDTPGWAFDVITNGSTAYVADGWGGIRVIDVSAQAKPVEVGSYEVAGGNAASLDIKGGILYVADRSNGLRVLDLTASGQLTQVGFYRPMGFADDVVVAGDYAYVAAGPCGLRIVDVSDPLYPREVGAYDTQGYAWSIAASGRYVYVASLATATVKARLHVIDTSDPSQLSQAASVVTDLFIRNMVIQGDILYGVDEQGLLLIDVSNPLAPRQLGFIQLAGPISGQPATVDVVVSGKTAYVAQSEGGLKVVDVSDAKAPVLVGTYDKENVRVMSVAVVDNFAYLGDQGRLHVVDISDPKNPKGLGLFQVSGVVDRIALVGDALYLPSGASGVQVVDISNRGAPVLAAACYVPGYAAGLTVDDNYIYVAAEDGGMFVLERSGKLSAAPNQSANGLSKLRYSEQVSTVLSVQPVAYNEDSGRLLASLTMPTQSQVDLADQGSITVPSKTRPDYAIPFTSGSILTVTSSADSGLGTLHWALENAHTGDTITFDRAVFPPSNPATIWLTSALPFLKQGNITIDASNAGVILDGSNTPAGTTGLLIFSDGNVIKGLQVIKFSGDGLYISNAKDNIIGGDRTQGSGPLGEGNLISGNGHGVVIFGPEATGNRVIGNYIGIDITGTSAMGNRYNGVILTGGASHNLIGGTTPEERNVISGNGWGGVGLADMGTSGNKIIGNYIGLDASGTRTLGHLDSGVYIGNGASGNIIGGTTPGERNVVSGNGREEIGLMNGANGNIIAGNYVGTDASGSINLGVSQSAVTMELGPFNNVVKGNVISTSGGVGVMISDWGTWGNEVIGNLIGVDTSGTVSLGGMGDGIHVNAPFNKIGGTTPEERNIISGNSGNGVKIGFRSTTDAIVIGNYIGTDVSGTKVIGNNGHGITMTEGTHHSFIGGMTEGEGNIISSNRESGISLDGIGVRYNFVMGNYIGTDTTGTTSLSNEFGITIAGAEHNFVQANLIVYNKGDGIGIIAYNKRGGIGIKPGTGNHIHHNSLIQNGKNSTDGGNNNQWDDGREGNYWSDYTGEDANGDRIGDTPYEIPGDARARDNYPLVAPPWNQLPVQPSNILPPDGADGIGLILTLQSSAFSDPDSGDTHSTSQWQIRIDSGDYFSPIFDSGVDNSSLNSITIPSGTLSYFTTYYWHVRYQDNHGTWSDWSAETSYKTAAGLHADFTADRTSVVVGQTIQFKGQSTGGVPPLSYQWDFNNDGIWDSTAQNPTHAYGATGTYTVVLKVTDSASNTDTETKTGYISVMNQPPNQPSNISPANGAADVSLTPTLVSPVFSDPDAGDTHAASQWQITTISGDYSHPVFDSGEDVSNRMSISILSSVLSPNTTYYWHVRHQDNCGAWSNCSAETSFTTITEEAKGLPFWIWIVTAIGIVVFIAGIAIVIRMFRIRA